MEVSAASDGGSARRLRLARREPRARLATSAAWRTRRNCVE
jgi:hypothetical protein